MDLHSLPDSLQTIVSDYSFSSHGDGMSPCEVYRLTGQEDVLFLKVSERRYENTTYGVGREKDVLRWLDGKLAVPPVVHFASDDDREYLLTAEADGVSLYERKDFGPTEVIDTYLEALRLIQSIDHAECPITISAESRLVELEYLLESGVAAEEDFYSGNTGFPSPSALVKYLKDNIPDQEPTFSHGDMSDGNFFVDGQHISGIIDWGRGGVGDKWFDIAMCIRSVREDLGEQHVRLLLERLEQKPNWDKIEYFLLLDVMF